MKVIAFSVSNDLREKIRRRRRRLASPLAGLGRAAGRVPLVGGRPPGRPRPGSRPGGSGGWPGGSGGWPAPWPAQAGSQAGRLWGVAGPLAGPGRLPWLPPACRSWPASRPATLHSPTAPFWSLLFKGFLPQINVTFCQPLELFSLPLLTFSSLAFSQSLR